MSQERLKDHDKEASYSEKRRNNYMKYPEYKFKEVIYSLGKSMQSQGMTVPQPLQDYLDFCDSIKRKHKKK